MPEYIFFCKSCNEELLITAKITEYPSIKNQLCPICSKKMIQRFFPSNVIFKDDPSKCSPGEVSTWPGKSIARQREDNYIKSVTKRARELKQSGKVKMEDHLSFKDVERLNPE